MSQFYEWLFGPEKFPGLSRNGPQARVACIKISAKNASSNRPQDGDANNELGNGTGYNGLLGPHTLAQVQLFHGAIDLIIFCVNMLISLSNLAAMGKVQKNIGSILRCP